MILELLKMVCTSLDETRINYMISGSIALNIYSIPRMSRDIDIVVELNEERVNLFASLFPESYLDINTIRDEIKRQGMFNVIDHKTGFKIDFFIRKNSEYYRTAFSRKKQVQELGMLLWVISLEDLIISKIIWSQQLQSDIQLFDIKGLLMNPEKDIAYIDYWCKKLQLNTFNLLNNE